MIKKQSILIVIILRFFRLQTCMIQHGEDLGNCLLFKIYQRTDVRARACVRYQGATL